MWERIRAETTKVSPKLRQKSRHFAEVALVGLAVGSVATAGIVLVPGASPPESTWKPKPKTPATASKLRIGQQLDTVRDLIAAKVAMRTADDANLPHLVVYVGECTSCSLSSFGPTDIDASRYGSVHFLFDNDSPARVNVIKLPANVHMTVLPTNAKVMRDLASDYAPRSYLFNAEGNLLDFQASMAEVPSFLHFKRNL